VYPADIPAPTVRLSGTLRNIGKRHIETRP
jgi:hypothetical protein